MGLGLDQSIAISKSYKMLWVFLICKVTQSINDFYDLLPNRDIFSFSSDLNIILHDLSKILKMCLLHNDKEFLFKSSSKIDDPRN